MDDPTADTSFESDLVDVTKLPISEVLATDESVLAIALRRIRTEIATSQEPVASHSSTTMTPVDVA